MANILSNLLKQRYSTPVLPIEINRASSLQGEAETSVDKILVHTEKTLRKEGGILFIDKEEISLETLNILDLLLLLKAKGIDVGFINSSDYWYYPALCILDFSNVDYREIKIQHTPFDISPYNQIRSLTITPLEETSYEVLNIFNLQTNIVPYKKVGNLISVGKHFQNNSTIIIKVISNKFILKVDSKFTTDKIETTARYLGEQHIDD